MDMQIPGYDIERELGDGAMAVVYLATQRSLDRKVALKVMAASLAADPTFCERFLREGKTLARLSHPNTVTIHDIGNVGSLYYMAMEYLPNGTLKERIAALRIGRDPGNGLRLSHETVSRAHAELSMRGGVWVLKDLGSTNGTTVNGHRVTGSAVVRDGDQVGFGNMTFRLSSS